MNTQSTLQSQGQVTHLLIAAEAVVRAGLAPDGLAVGVLPFWTGGVAEETISEEHFTLATEADWQREHPSGQEMYFRVERLGKYPSNQKSLHEVPRKK